MQRTQLGQRPEAGKTLAYLQNRECQLVREQLVNREDSRCGYKSSQGPDLLGPIEKGKEFRI